MRTDVTFHFGDFELDEPLRELRKRGRRIELQTQALSVLLCLLRNAGRTVTHDEFARDVWRDAHVEPGSLRSAISVVRKALAPPRRIRGNGTTSNAAGFVIQSERGVGYRFLSSVKVRTAREASSATLRPGVEPTPTDFVDREIEMAELRAACRAALAGERQVALLEGPPGIGKTRTATELTSAAQAMGFEVHVGRAHEGKGGRPGQPWVQVILDWIDERGHDGLEALGIRGGVDRLAGFLDGVPPNERDRRSGSEGFERFRLFNQMRRFLETATCRRPLLLVLDDLHADLLSLEILAFVTETVSRARLLIVGTHRPLPTNRARSRVLHEPGTRSLSLAGLEPRSVARILARVLGSEPEPGLVEEIHGASAGNPFFVSELARAAARAGSGRARSALPSVHAVVWSRVSECSSACRDLLQTACLMGPELSLAHLRSAGFESGVLLRALEEAQQRDLLEATPEGFGFVHAIVRESLEKQMGVTERMDLHRRIAESLEPCAAADPARHVAKLAYHLSECAPLAHADRAVAYGRRAAEAARSSFAYAEAAEFYRRALRAAELLDSPDPALRGELLFDLAEVLVYAGAPATEFQGAFIEAVELARAAGLPLLGARAAARCIVHLFETGHLSAAYAPIPQIRSRFLRSVLEDLRDVAEVAEDRPLFVRVLLAIAFLAEADRDRRRVMALADEVRAIARVEPVPSPDAFEPLLALELDVLVVGRELRFGIEHCARRGESVDPRAEAMLVARDCVSALQRGDRAPLDAGIRRLGRLAEEVGAPVLKYQHQLARALDAQLSGPLDLARTRVLEAADSGTRANFAPDWVATALLLTAHWLAVLGGFTDSVVSQSEQYHASRVTPPEARIFQARLYAGSGQREQALAELQAFVRLDPRANPFWLLHACLAAETCAIVGDRATAAQLFRDLAPHAARTLVVGTFICCHGLVARPLGSLAALLGHWSEAADLFERAARHARSLRAPVLDVLACTDRALAFGTHPDACERERAQELGRATAARASALGLHGLVQRLQS